jgi:AraC family transcriptional regulator, arabinose operon regulatory protein
MKIATRTYSSVAHRPGENGYGTARNGKTGDSTKLSAEALVGQARPQSNDARAKLHCRQLAVPSGRGAMVGSALSSGLIETPGREFVPVAAGRSEAAAGLPGRAASENEFIFVYCIRGRGWCEIEGNRHEIMPSQLLVIPPKSPATFGTYGERLWSLIWIQLATTNTSPSAAKSHITPQTVTLGPIEKQLILALFQDVLHAFEMPCPQRLQQVSQRAMTLLDGSICIARKSPQMETDAASRIGRTIEYMREHLNEPLRAATLAGVANMSLPHYFAQFKRVIGSSPIDYLIKLRMEHARQLLEQTSWSVKEVAVSLGYDDPLYFSRVFKSVNQTAPSDFRARTRDTSGG